MAEIPSIKDVELVATQARKLCHFPYYISLMPSHPCAALLALLGGKLNRRKSMQQVFLAMTLRGAWRSGNSCSY